MLTFLGSMAALYGGGLVAWLYGGIDPDIYLQRLTDAISLHPFRGRHPQGAVHGAGHRHRRLRRRAESQRQRRFLGLKTTASVVKSIFLVIVLDGLFAIFFASIGM